MARLIDALRRAGGGLIVAALAALGVAACGGGGGGHDVAGVGSGGTGTVSSPVTVGSISGFGSVIIAGVRYDDSAATVGDEDGNPRSRADLRLGMVATIRGSADFAAGTGSAAEIRYGSEILGPVDAVDVAGGRLTVLGATVAVKPATVFDERLAGLAALRVGDRVEVYGFYNAAAGSYTATRIELAPLATRFKLRAPVSALDTATRRFTLAGVRIDYGAVPVQALPALAEGIVVRASAGIPPVGGLWGVDALGAAPRTMPADGEFRIEGDIAAMSSPRVFVVDGMTVDAGGASIAGTLAVGRRVEVEGRVQAGILVAREVESSDEDAADDEAFELSGLIESFEPLSRRFSLRGQLIDAGGPVSYENGSAANLANGRRIELKGYFDAASGTVVATQIHFED